MLVKTDSQNNVIEYPYRISKLKFENPNVSFPEVITKEILNSYNIFEVSETVKPEYDSVLQNVTEGTPEIVDGAWTQTWVISDASQEEIDSRIENLKRRINNHRERLILAGCNVSIANVGTVYVTGAQEDVRNISALGQIAIIRVMSGDETTVIFRDGNNNIFTLTPQQIIEISRKFVDYISAIYKSSWDLKEMQPIPEDYTQPNYWPSNNL